MLMLRTRKKICLGRLEQVDMSGEASQMQVGAGLATQTAPANENLVCPALFIYFSADKQQQCFRKVVTVEDVLESFLRLPSGLCLEVNV